LKVIAKPAFKNAAKNPYNALLYSALQNLDVEIAEFSVKRLKSSFWDICHIHWPESLLERKTRISTWWSAKKYLGLIDFARRQGTKIVWTIHDLKPHHLFFPHLEQQFWSEFLQRLDGVIALTRTGLQLAHERMPIIGGLPAFIIPHGHYRGIYPQTVDRDAARQRLGIPQEATVLAYFGQIRPYKNVPRLIQVVREFGDANTTLLVCGKPDRKHSSLVNEIQAAAAADARIRLLLNYIADNDVQLYLKAADLLILPYKNILNSGSALLGLSFDCPVLVPNLGAMAELQTAVGPDWVKTYEGELDGTVLREAIAWARWGSRGKQAPLDPYDWGTIGRQTLDAYYGIRTAHEPA